MADKLISQLGARAAVLTTDLMPLEPIAGPPAEKAAVSQLVTLLNTIYAPITGGAYVLKAGDTMTGLLQFSGTGHFGLRLNNLTTAQRDAIGVGSSGNAIWNTTTSRFDFNIGGSWMSFVRLSGDTMTGLLAIAQATANTSILTSTGYSLTGANAQNMLDFAGTWNTSGNPTALRIAITNTASGATSRFLEFFAGAGGATSQFLVEKDGRSAGLLSDYMSFETFNTQAQALARTITQRTTSLASINFAMSSGYQIGWTSGNGAGSDGGNFGVADTILSRDSAGVFAQRNGVTAQTFRLYRTFTDLSNYERLALQTAAGQIIIAAETAGTGTDNIDVVITAAGTGLVNASLGIFRLGTAKTVATLPAAGTQGRIAYVTDSLAPAFLTTVVGGGAVITTVFDNGTNWVAV